MNGETNIFKSDRVHNRLFLKFSTLHIVRIDLPRNRFVYIQSVSFILQPALLVATTRKREMLDYLVRAHVRESKKTTVNVATR